jgi:pilus assembly protein Flp/PilA
VAQIDFKLIDSFLVRRRRETRENPDSLTPGGAVLRRLFRCFLAEQSAATAIEYALIACAISIAILAAVNGIGTTLSNSFAWISTSLK